MDQEAISTAFDQREVFNKLRAHDRLGHGTVSTWLEGFLAGRGRRDLRLLDLGCNDGATLARVLAAGDVAAYTGVDPDAHCIAAAWENLADSPASVALQQADARDVLAQRPQAEDVIWMGLLLHHFPKAAKANLFALAKNALRPGGALLTHDPMPGDGETVAAFLDRFNRTIETDWTELTADERRVLVEHWRHHGQHDPVDVVEELARKAGFSRVHRRRLDATGLFVLLRFEA